MVAGGMQKHREFTVNPRVKPARKIIVYPSDITGFCIIVSSFTLFLIGEECKFGWDYRPWWCLGWSLIEAHMTICSSVFLIGIISDMYLDTTFHNVKASDLYIDRWELVTEKPKPYRVHYDLIRIGSSFGLYPIRLIEDYFHNEYRPWWYPGLTWSDPFLTIYFSLVLITYEFETCIFSWTMDDIRKHSFFRKIWKGIAVALIFLMIKSPLLSLSTFGFSFLFQIMLFSLPQEPLTPVCWV